MAQIKTVGDLIYKLKELDPDMPIMAQHQPTWPLREVIGGIWVDDGTSEEDECESCSRLALAPPQEAKGDNETLWFRECYYCHHQNEVDKPEEVVAYIVLNGHPYDKNPYGSKNAWNVI